MAPNHSGEALRSILGSMGSHLDQEMCQTLKNYHALKFEFLTTPRGHRFTKKNLIYGYGAKSRRGPLRSILTKMGQNPKKLPCPKIRIFDYSAVIDLGKKSNLRLWR